MIPLHAIGDMSWSDSNHSDRKSTADIVVSLNCSRPRSSPRSRNRFPNPRSWRTSLGRMDMGSGAFESMIGLAKRASLPIARPNSG